MPTPTSVRVRRLSPAEANSSRMAAIGDVDEATLDGLLGIAGLAGDGGALEVPARMAGVNALLDAAPPALREALLVAVLDRLTRIQPGMGGTPDVIERAYLVEK